MELRDAASDRTRTSGGAPSARGFLLTLLGEFVLPAGGTAWTQQLIGALGLLGVEQKAGRQAISRSASRGLLVPERIGRRARWSLTASASKLLSEGSERIYRFGREDRVWDGRWLLVFATIPEVPRQRRYHVRNQLGWAGFAPFAPGVWISPWVEREREAVQVLGELEGASTTCLFVATLGEVGAAPDVAATAWDLGRVQSEYEEFIRSQSRLAPRSPEACFVAVTKLVHEWRKFPALDPRLPRQLLPADWPGAQAAEMFGRLRALWSPSARDWWDRQGQVVG
jgi:phenylacetic acid degradation operon negative regulatory protein